jgi:hypothetical protein
MRAGAYESWRSPARRQALGARGPRAARKLATVAQPAAPAPAGGAAPAPPPPAPAPAPAGPAPPAPAGPQPAAAADSCVPQCVAAASRRLLSAETREFLRGAPWYLRAAEAAGGALPRTLPVYAAGAAAFGCTDWCVVVRDAPLPDPLRVAVAWADPAVACLVVVELAFALTRASCRRELRLMPGQPAGDGVRWLEAVLNTSEGRAALAAADVQRATDVLALHAESGLAGLDDCGAMETLRRKYRLAAARA